VNCYPSNFNLLTRCRQVDIMTHMNKNTDAPRQEPKTRQIVGFSLPPALASEVKVEAAKRNLSLRKLFGEMWNLYKMKKTA
jgi:hypothetical protein